MENTAIMGMIDHTQLKAFCTMEDIRKLCREAAEYKTASVCIPPSYIKRVKEEFGDSIKLCTVIGFPLGYMTTETKCFEAADAVKNGADEIDMVINIGDVKNGDWDIVTDEIAAVKKACDGRLLKVIVETCYLTQEEKVRVCKSVTDAGADFIKTSTGFGTGGATTEDVKLFKENIGPDVKIKAAGGINTREDMEALIAAGADRLGSSKGVSVLA